jgi:hypothetical protein
MNQTINKIVESIESLSGEERYLLFKQLAKRKIFNGYEKLYPDVKESLEIAESDSDDTSVMEIKASLKTALQEAKAGKRIPLEKMWEGIDAE